MDTITDILSTFFVSTTKETTKKKRSKVKKVDKETQFESFEILDDSVIDEEKNNMSQTENVKFTENNQTIENEKTKQDISKKSVSKPSIKVSSKISKKSVSKASTKVSSKISKKSDSKASTKVSSKISKKSGSKASTKVSSKISKKSGSKASTKVSSTGTSISSKKSGSESSNSNEDTSSGTRKNIKSKNMSFKTPSKTSSETSKDISSENNSNVDNKYSSESSDSDTSLDKSLEKKYKIKKCISKNKQFVNSNLLLMNKLLDTNLDMLNQILYDYSLMDDCKEKFEKCIYVISNNSNKFKFKKIFDENPYLHFTEIKIASKITQNIIKEFKNSDKLNILILDGSLDLHIINDILYRTKNINLHILFLASNYSINLYKKLKKLNDSYVILHKNSKNIRDEKKFYKNILEKYSSNLDFKNYFSLDNIIYNSSFVKYF
jgi:hypothetical protein